MSRRRIDLHVTDAKDGMRLDQFLATVEEIGSRARAVKMIEHGDVKLDGETAKKSDRLLAGQFVSFRAAETSPARSAPAVPFTIVYEDSDLLVVDKPAGLVVHPAPGNPSGTLSQALEGNAGGDALRPGIVHRLDKDTSGLLVVAKNERSLRALRAQLERRDIHRQYTALVGGRSESRSGTIDAPLGRDRRQPEMITVRSDSGREAITHFTVIEELGSRSLLRVKLDTGRTHQIRVHLAAVGMPVCGDPQYGLADDLGLERQFLHASELTFKHPSDGRAQSFASPLPEDLEGALTSARSASR